MKKVELQFRYENESYDKEEEVDNGVIIYSNDNCVLICNKNNEVIAEITADCSQNTAYLKYNEIKHF